MPNELIRGSYGAYNLSSDSEDATADLTALDARVDILEARRISAATEFHVDPVSGSDSNVGSLASPFLTVAKALNTGIPLLGTSTGAVQVLLHPGSYGTVTLPLPGGYMPPVSANVADTPPLSIEAWASAANRNVAGLDERYVVVAGPFTSSAATKAASDAHHIKYTLTGAAFTADEHVGVRRMAMVFSSGGVFKMLADIGENGTDYVLLPRNSNLAYTQTVGDIVYIVRHAVEFTRLSLIGAFGGTVLLANFSTTGQDSVFRCVGDQIHIGPTCWGVKSGGSAGDGLILEGPCTYRSDASPTWITAQLGWTSAEQTAVRHKGLQVNSNSNSKACVRVGQAARKSLTTLVVTDPWVSWGTIQQEIGGAIAKQAAGSHHRKFRWICNDGQVTINCADHASGGAGSGHLVQRDTATLPAVDWNDTLFYSELFFGWTFYLRGTWAGPFSDLRGSRTRIQPGYVAGPNTVTLASGVLHRVRDGADANLDAANFFGLAASAAGASSLDVEVGDASTQVTLAAIGTAKVISAPDGSLVHPERAASGALSGMHSLQSLNLRVPISPAALAANTDNWNPTGLANATVIRVDASAAVNVTGISITALPSGLGSGRLLYLTHIGTNAANTITLTHEDALSTAAHRFLLPNASRAGGLALAIGDTVLLWYDITTARWRVL